MELKKKLNTNVEIHSIFDNKKMYEIAETFDIKIDDKKNKIHGLIYCTILGRIIYKFYKSDSEEKKIKMVGDMKNAIYYDSGKKVVNSNEKVNSSKKVKFNY